MKHLESLALMAKVHMFLLKNGEQPTENIRFYLLNGIAQNKNRTWTRSFLHRAETWGFVATAGTVCAVNGHEIGGDPEIVWKATPVDTRLLVGNALKIRKDGGTGAHWKQKRDTARP